MTNRVATVSVLRYAIWHNSTSNNATVTATTDASVVTSSTTAESYTDLTPYCETNEVFLADTESKAETLIKDTKRWTGFVIDAFFLLLMLVSTAFVAFISVYRLKLQHIPLFMRSSKITKWAYIMRFKTVGFFTFMIMSSFFHRYNLFDLSLGCLTCYGSSKNCVRVSDFHFASTAIALFIFVPIFLTLATSRFTDKIKYVTGPIILINIVFLVALIILS